MAQHGGVMVKDLNGEEGALEWLQRRRRPSQERVRG
jgi:hypothetical protein